MATLAAVRQALAELVAACRSQSESLPCAIVTGLAGVVPDSGRRPRQPRAAARASQPST
jgi:hypothetical protein